MAKPMSEGLDDVIAAMGGRASSIEEMRSMSPTKMRAGERKEGTLRKRNERGKWQRRWFVLDGLQLKYYQNSGSNSTKGSIPLSHITSIAPPQMVGTVPYAFGLRCHMARVATVICSAPRHNRPISFQSSESI